MSRSWFAAIGMLTGLAFVAPLSFAANAPVTDYRQVPAVFFQKLSQGKTDEAVDYVFGLGPWMSTRPDDVQNVKTSLSKVAGLVGEYLGNELIVERPLGKRFVHLVYFGYFDRQPIRFVFDLYKSKDSWTTYSFNFDDKFSSELADASPDKGSAKQVGSQQ